MAENRRRFNEMDKSMINMMTGKAFDVATQRGQWKNGIHGALKALRNELHELVARAQELGIADPNMDPRAAAVYLEALSYGIVLMEFMENPPSREALSAMLFRGFAALLKP